MKTIEILRENKVMINNKPVDMSSIEIDGVDPKDRPDFVDAYIQSASFEDGTELTDKELDQLTDEQSDLVHDMAHDSFH